MNNKLTRTIFTAALALTVFAQYAEALTVTRVSATDVSAASYLAFNPFNAIESVSAGNTEKSDTVEYVNSVTDEVIRSVGAYSLYSRPAIRIPYRPSLRSTYRPPLY